MLVLRIFYSCLLGYLSVVLSNIENTYEYLENPVIALKPKIFTVCIIIMFLFMGLSSHYLKTSKSALKNETESLYKSAFLIALTWAPIFFLIRFRVAALIWILALNAFIFKYIALSLKINKKAAYYMFCAFLFMIYILCLNAAFILVNI